MTQTGRLIPIRTSSDECWMQTYSGKVFYPLNPRQEDIDISDIAGALSKQCRFAGHCLHFYSVAEHCVHVSDAAQPGHKLQALMHDASEAYLCDIPRPVKPQLVGYRDIEENLMLAIAIKYGFSWPMDPAVKALDTAILTDEREQNMANMNVEPLLWGNVLPPLGIKMKFWSPNDAFGEFMARFHRLGGVNVHLLREVS